MLPVSTLRITSATPKRPTIAGMKLTPFEKSMLPKVKRGNPRVMSMPTVESSSPSSTARPALAGLPEAIITVAESPSAAIQKYSKEVNWRATSARAEAAEHQADGAEDAADGGADDVDSQHQLALALLRHLVRLVHVGGRRGGARDAHQCRRYVSREDGHRGNGDHGHQRREGFHEEGEWHQEGDRHGRGEARDGPEEEAQDSGHQDREDHRGLSEMLESLAAQLPSQPPRMPMGNGTLSIFSNSITEKKTSRTVVGMAIFDLTPRMNMRPAGDEQAVMMKPSF